MPPSDARTGRGEKVVAGLRRSWFRYWLVIWFVGGAATAALLVLGVGWPYEALEAPFFLWFVSYLVVVDLFAPRHAAPDRWRLARWIVAVGLLVSGAFAVRYVDMIVS